MRIVLAFFIWMVMPAALAGSFLGATGASRDRIVHAMGYAGHGGERPVTVCLDSGFPFIEAAEPRILDTISLWNSLAPATRNIAGGVPPGQYDFMSVLLHELGHCVFGLAHPNDGDYAIADPGADGYNFAPGPDGLPGTQDDARGDDQPRSWFSMTTNDPFVTIKAPSPATMGIQLSQLPAGHGFPAAPTSMVSEHLGHGFTRAVMSSRSSSGKRYTWLAADEVNTAKLAETGLDELRGTADDYHVRMQYVGVAESCDVKIHWKTPSNASSMLASCGWSSTPLSGRHHVNQGNRSIAFYNTHTFWFGSGADGGGADVDRETPADSPVCESDPRPVCDGSLTSRISVGMSGRINVSMRAKARNLKAPDQARVHPANNNGAKVAGFGTSACLYLGDHLARSWHVDGGGDGWKKTSRGWSWQKRNSAGNEADVERVHAFRDRLTFRGTQAPMPPYTDDRVTLQLVSGDGSCWGETWSATAIKKNGKSFKANDLRVFQ